MSTTHKGQLYSITLDYSGLISLRLALGKALEGFGEQGFHVETAPAPSHIAILRDMHRDLTDAMHGSFPNRNSFRRA